MMRLFLICTALLLLAVPAVAEQLRDLDRVMEIRPTALRMSRVGPASDREGSSEAVGVTYEGRRFDLRLRLGIDMRTRSRHPGQDRGGSHFRRCERPLCDVDPKVPAGDQ